VSQNLEIVHSPDIRSYLSMLNDRWRNEFFHRALFQHCQDRTVLDMGTGTGILAFYALEAGARFVYCIESRTNIAQLADQVLSKKFSRSRYKIIAADLWTQDLRTEIDQEIDILVSETLGPGLFDQGMLHTWHCVRPLLSPTAISIPDRLHCDAWVWSDRTDSAGSFEPQLGRPDLFSEIDTSATMSTEFNRCLLEVDQQPFAPTGHPMFWYEINKEPSEPTMKYQDVISYKMHQSPLLVSSDSPYPQSINPDMSFDITVKKPSMVAIINKISFESHTLYLKDALYMPWKYQPVFVLERPGTYTFTYQRPWPIPAQSEWECVST